MCKDDAYSARTGIRHVLRSRAALININERVKWHVPLPSFRRFTATARRSFCTSFVALQLRHRTLAESE